MDNKLKTSLNAYMAKHGLNTNAASIAIGVSVPTLRKALRGHNVSRKTTAKIESIIASGKVPEAAKTTVKRTPKKTAAAKPAAKTRTRQTTAKAPATKPSTTKQAATKTPTRQAKAQTQPTSIAATDQNQAAVHSQENSASPQSPRRTTKRVARTTTTGRQVNRNTRQSPSTSGANTASESKPTTKRPTTRNHRFTIRQQPDVATQQAQSEANKRQAQSSLYDISKLSNTS